MFYICKGQKILSGYYETQESARAIAKKIDCEVRFLPEYNVAWGTTAQIIEERLYVGRISHNPAIYHIPANEPAKDMNGNELSITWKEIGTNKSSITEDGVPFISEFNIVVMGC